MQGRLQEFSGLGSEVVAITFVATERLRGYLESSRWPFRVLADPELTAYRAFGLERAAWSQLFRPRVIARYLQLMIRGRVPHIAREDVRQLGGDFVLDREGRVVYAFRSEDPADRPDVDTLIEAVRGCSA